MTRRCALLILALAALLIVRPVLAAAPLPLDRTVVTQSGDRASVGALIGGKASIVVPVYYRCPNLCALTFGHFLDAAQALPGRRFNVMVYSIDDNETPADIAAFAASALQDHTLPQGTVNFTIADTATIQALNAALGFTFTRDDKTGQFGHPSIIAAVAADGQVVRRLGGLHYSPQDLERALTARTAAADESLWLTCYHALTGAGPAARVLLLVRIADGMIIAALTGGVFLLLRRRTRGS